MIANDHATVLVDFVIDQRDLFRAYMEMSRWRFVIGVVIMLALSLPLGYFFILIGEQKILLQTSPLFIGVPLIALVGQVLRLHASARKYVTALSESQRRIHYMFEWSSDGYDSRAGGSYGHIVWTDVMHKTGYLLIYLNRFEVGVLPKRGFQSADIPVFRDIVHSKLGSQAKVLTRQA